MTLLDTDGKDIDVESPKTTFATKVTTINMIILFMFELGYF